MAKAKDKTPPKNKRSSKRWTITAGSGRGLTVDGIPVLRDTHAIVQGLKKDKVIGIDLETTGFSAWRNEIALIQLYGEQSKTLGLIQTPNGVIPPEVKSLFTKDKLFIVHNGVGFDMWFMDTHGLPWKNSQWHDTLVAETVLTSSGRRDVSKSLRASVRRRLGKEIDKDIEHGKWGAKDLSDSQLEYAASDVISLPALYRTHLEKAEASGELPAIEMEMKLAPIVAQMSINGLPCPRWHLEEYVEGQREVASKHLRFLWSKFGQINLGSHQQLKAALHKNGIPVPDTKAETLEPLMMVQGPHTKIIEPLMEWKKANHRIKMYSEQWMDENIVNDTVHAHFWQCSADTTRFTSSKPNLQQVPKNGRYIIGHKPGWKIVSVDYSQIEVRIAAKIAHDEVLMTALEEEDVHRSIAAEVFEVDATDVSKHQRSMAKAMTFLLLFGGGVPRFYEYVKLLGGSITYEEAANMVFMFFSRFSGLHAIRKQAERRAKQPGPMIIRLPNTTRRILVGYTKRTAVILNTMVQGTAAVGLKAGIIEADKRGLTEYLGATVHDELVACVPNRFAKSYSKELAKAMIDGMKSVMDITVKAGISIGDVWQA